MMKHLLRMSVVVALILSIVSCSGSGAGTSVATISSGPASDNVDQTITRLEHDWVTAIVNKDTVTLDRLIADDFSGTTNDQVYSKGDAIEDVKTGTHESLDLDNIRVRLFGDTAVVTMGQTEKSRHGDSDFSGTLPLYRRLGEEEWSMDRSRLTRLTRPLICSENQTVVRSRH